MGAPKQKWTAEEEAALKAGVLKHGTGKWRTILSDPEFSTILHSRSNVDLKDKWRNINVTAIWGSRQKAKLALKRTSLTPKHDGRAQLTPKQDGRTQLTQKHEGRTQLTSKPDDNPMALSIVPQHDEEVADAKPLAISGGTMRSYVSKEPVARLDKLIVEAITNLKDSGGSDRASIANYIEENYWAPANLRKLLATKLKLLTANGSLIKVKHKYSIAPSGTASVAKKSPKLPLEEKVSPKTQKKDINTLTKSQVEADLLRMRGMTAQEAAAAAAQAIAEAEIAMAEAEEAAREAEKAEAEAEAAQVFAKAAIKALKYRTLRA